MGRVKKELKEVLESKSAGIEARLVDSDYTHWKGIIDGPVLSYSNSPHPLILA